MRKLLVIFGLLFVLGVAQAQTPRMAIYEAVSNVQGVILDEDYVEGEDVTLFVVMAEPSQYLSEDLVMLMVDRAFRDGRVVQPWTRNSDGSLTARYLIYDTLVLVRYGTLLGFGYPVESRGI